MSCRTVVKYTRKLRYTGYKSIWQFSDVRVFKINCRVKVISDSLKDNGLAFVFWVKDENEIVEFTRFVEQEELFIGHWTSLISSGYVGLSSEPLIAFSESDAMMKFKLFARTELTIL